jgi:hypoxanthine phosphoribosyltransferase
MINAGSVLSAQYDVCVGVVPSGTFPAHVFSLFGLKTLFAVPRTYRPNRRVIGYVRRLDEVAWVGEGDEKFEDKRVLMVDDGIATDQTHREIVSLIETRMPQYIDFFVMRAPPEFRLPPQTKRESEVSGSVREKYLAAGVPRVVRKVLSPDMLSYRGFYDAIVTLEKKLGIRE